MSGTFSTKICGILRLYLLSKTAYMNFFVWFECFNGTVVSFTLTAVQPPVAWVIFSSVEWILFSCIAWILFSCVAWELFTCVAWVLLRCVAWLLFSCVAWVLLSCVAWVLFSCAALSTMRSEAHSYFLFQFCLYYNLCYFEAVEQKLYWLVSWPPYSLKVSGEADRWNQTCPRYRQMDKNAVVGI